MKISSLSIFFPVYNEEHALKKTVENAQKILQKINLKYEILIINDGSIDRTAKVAEEIIKKQPVVKLINQPNGGYGSALKAGFDNSRYEWIVYTDADGQFDFSDIKNFLAVDSDYAAIWGYKSKRNDPFARLIFSRLWSLSLWLFFGLKFRDVNCGFKMIRRDAYQKIKPLLSKRGGMINAELAIKLCKQGFKIAQVPVSHFPRTAGQATGANLAVVFSSYLDLIRFWWKMKTNAKKTF